MAILDILTHPDPRLKLIAEAVTDFGEALALFVADLEETMRSGPAAVGIAATQVGVSKRVVIVDVSAKPQIPNHGRLVLINPEITHWEGYVMGREGCLSVPEYTGNVMRAEHIALRAQDECGVWQDYPFQGYEARAVQHEIDHLEGILFIDRLVSRRSDLFLRKKR